VLSFTGVNDGDGRVVVTYVLDDGVVPVDPPDPGPDAGPINGRPGFTG
jgi:hypothetical protein